MARLKTAWPELLILGLGLLVNSSVAKERVRAVAQLDDSSRTITGHVSMVVADVSPNLSALHFRLYPNRFCDSTPISDSPCGLVVDSLFVNGANRIGEATISATDMSIPITYEGLTDRELAIESYFTLSLPRNRDRFGYLDGIYSLEAWLPVLAPREDTGWLVIDYTNPTVEPVGDPVDFDVSLTVPSNLQVMAPGLVDSLTHDSLTTYHLVLQDAAHLPVVITRGFSADTRLTDSIAHTVFFRPESDYAIDSIQAWIEFTLNFMNDHVLRYPKNELVLVVGALAQGGGLEHPQMIWISDLFPVSPLYSPRMVVVHEVIHEWFYYLVNSNQAADPWLDEAVTEYFTLRVLTAMTAGKGELLNYYGMTASYDLQHRIATDRLFAYARLDQPADSIGERDLFPTIYAKGAELMATLTAQMGQREDQFWQTWTQQHLYRRPPAESFYALAESFVRGDQVGRVKTLLTTLNRPDYSVARIANDSLSNEGTTADSSVESSPAYRSTVRLAIANAIPFPVELRFVYADGSVVDTVAALPSGTYAVSRTADQKLVGAHIDPSYLIRIDDNFVNNSLYLDPVNSADQRILSIVTYLVESLYSVLWGI